jgi:type IV pilus assembly protein PilW
MLPVPSGNPRGQLHREYGFTLVELMVAMAIGIFLILGLTTLATNISRNNNEMSKMNRQIENGSYAFQILENDIAHAGYWGGFVPRFDDLSFTEVPTDVPAAIPDPCPSPTAVPAPWTALWAAAGNTTNLIGIPVQGYEIPAVVPNPTTPVCAAIVATPRASTDVLVVRHAERCAVGTVVGTTGCPVLTPTPNEVYMQVQRCGISAPNPAYALEKYVAANAATLFPLQNRSCTTASELRKFVSNLYYVRAFAEAPGDNTPTLMRSQIVGGVQATAEALVEGVDGFRVEYGVDNLSETGANVDYTAAVIFSDPTTRKIATNRGDGVPDGNYVRCTVALPCTAAQLTNTVAVRVHLLVRNETRTPGYQDTKTYQLGATTLGPFNDEFKRHVFTQTIRLHNVSARRETPN